MPQLPTLIPTNHGPIVMHMGMMPIIVLHFTQNYDNANHIRLILVSANILGKARRGKVQPIKVYTLPNSSKDSNVIMKVKTIKEKRVGMRSLVHNTLGVRGVCWRSRMKTKMSDKQVNYSHRPTQTKQQVG
jgi:hypothetical protein